MGMHPEVWLGILKCGQLSQSMERHLKVRVQHLEVWIGILKYGKAPQSMGRHPEVRDGILKYGTAS